MLVDTDATVDVSRVSFLDNSAGWVSCQTLLHCSYVCNRMQPFHSFIPSSNRLVEPLLFMMYRK
jgi:hypothetical protein